MAGGYSYLHKITDTYLLEYLDLFNIPQPI